MATATETMTLKKGLATTGQITRFNIHQRIQHFFLMISFTVLVLTGLPLKFPTLGVSQWWAGIWGGIEVTRSAHHFSAWVMVFVCLYHIIYLFHTHVILKKPFPVQIIPSREDVTKLIQEMQYYVGMRKERPLYDRFNWREKFDYFAIFWGMPVMAGSGFILMYPVLATKFLPSWIVPAALIAHSDEAMLALVWIFMVHIFFNHFTPGWFPVNKSIFTGKVPKERYQKEHSLEYARLMENEGGNEKS